MPKKASTLPAHDVPKVPLRERILEVADELFYRDGIHVTGVDTIIAKSGVAKTTLYRYFPSKDDLVVAYLERRNKRFWTLFEEVVAQHPDNPKAQLLAIFAWLEELMAKPECYGCPFIITTTEFPKLDHPGHQVAIAHKQKVRDRFTELAQKAGATSPKELGTNLLLLLDGAFVGRRLFGLGSVGRSLTSAATTLIQAHLSTTSSTME